MDVPQCTTRNSSPRKAIRHRQNPINDHHNAARSPLWTAAVRRLVPPRCSPKHEGNTGTTRTTSAAGAAGTTTRNGTATDRGPLSSKRHMTENEDLNRAGQTRRRGERPKSPKRLPHDIPERRADGRGTYQLAHRHSDHPPRRQPAAAAASPRQGGIATANTGRTDADEARHGRLHTYRDASPATGTEDTKTNGESRRPYRPKALRRALGRVKGRNCRSEAGWRQAVAPRPGGGDGGDGDTDRRPRAADRKRGCAPHEGNHCAPGSSIGQLRRSTQTHSGHTA